MIETLVGCWRIICCLSFGWLSNFGCFILFY